LTEDFFYEKNLFKGELSAKIWLMPWLNVFL
jgi:hypothetical protein